MLEAPPSVISSTWRGTWVISVTLSKSMEERVRPAPRRTVMPLSSESYSPAARHSTAQIVSVELSSIFLKFPVEVVLHVQCLLTVHLSFLSALPLAPQVFLEQLVEQLC